MLAGMCLFAGCVTYVQPPPPPAEQQVYVQPPPPEQPPVEYVAPEPETVVVIHSERDFDEPLQPYGRWIDVPGYGHCWTPYGVDRDWRPYADGHWQRTDDGWYWVSDERWGWATYHYGRWHRDDDYGWVWIPQTQWAPAWVEWREGGGYTGWAPLPPEVRIESGRNYEHREENDDPHSFVFVEQRRMMEPHRHQDVIVNNTTIINNTINVTKIQVVNNTIINEGPRPEVVQQATGHKVDVVPARTLRTRQEAQVVGKPHGQPAVNQRVPEPGNYNKPHEPNVSNKGRPPVVKTELRPAHNLTLPEQPANQPDRLRPEPNQPPRQITPEQIKPAQHSQPNIPTEQRHEVKKPEVPPGQLRPKPNQPPEGSYTEQIKPVQHPQPNSPTEHTHEVTKPEVPPGQLRPRPGQPPESPYTEQIRPQPHTPPNQSPEHRPEVKQPGQPTPAPQQQLEQEQKRKADEKLRQGQQNPHARPSTNSPAPPH